MKLDDDFVYHVTYYKNLDSIAEEGLVPGCGSSIGRGAGYCSHSSGRVFLSNQDGVGYWYDRAEIHANDMSDDVLEDGLIPVVIRVNTKGVDSVEHDDVGSSDSCEDAWYTETAIEAPFLDVWNGDEWADLDDPIDSSIALDEEGYFLLTNPLAVQHRMRKS